MKIYQLPDGSWTTSPVYIGSHIEKCCDEDKHVWETKGDKSEVPESATSPDNIKYMSLQVCKRCKYQRILLTKE